MCQVTAATVAKWIDDGKMNSYQTAGGHRRVSEADLVSFMRKLSLPIPPELDANNSLHVLIVDDDPADRERLAYLIKKSFPNATILEAENGFDMGHKVATFRPVLILLDLLMPGIDGFQACELIRRDPKLKDVKIVAVSGLDDAGNRKKIMEKGADGFVSKNADNEVLTEKLRDFLTTGRVYANGTN